jgi:ubiquinone/menaquinone biosynthesis C-methylase UbiE
MGRGAPGIEQDPVADDLRKLQSVVEGVRSREPRPLRVLDAGCGSRGQVEFGTDAHVVGIDISQEQLDRNTAVDEKVLGSIETYRLPDADFDIVICWNVLEHLPHPDRALTNLMRSVRPNGLIILRFPNVASLKGLITKFTPHAVHIWVLKHVLGKRRAGKEGRGPFPTFLRSSIAPDSIRRFAARGGFSTAHLNMFEGRQQRTIRRKLGIVGPVWEFLKRFIRLATFNRVSPDLTECTLVLRKRPSASLDVTREKVARS